MNLVGNRVAVITDGTSGIGAATALRFVKNKSKGLVLTDINVEKAQPLIDGMNTAQAGCCIAVKANVAREQDAENVICTVAEAFGAVDVLVNSAGICSIRRC